MRIGRKMIRRAIGMTLFCSGIAALVYSSLPRSWRGLGLHSTKRALPLLVFESVKWQAGIELSVYTRAGLEWLFVRNDAADAWATGNPNALSDGHFERHWANPGDETPWRATDPVFHRANVGSIKLEWQLSRVPNDVVGPHFVLAVPWSIAQLVAAAAILLPILLAVRSRRRGGTRFDVAPRPLPLAALPSDA